MRLPICLAIALLTLAPVRLSAQARKEVAVVFKDGFHIQGKVMQKTDWFNDPVTGVSFTIPKAGSMMYLDDNVRKIYFSPFQMADVLDKKNERDLMMLARYKSAGAGDSILPGWEFEKVTDWDNKWVRWFTVSTTTSSRKMEMEQRILYITPEFLHIQTRLYNWDIYYFTKELGPKVTRDLIVKFLDDKKKELKEHERLFEIAKFFFQAGWLKEAEQELDGIVEKYPDEKKAVQPLRDSIRKLQAEEMVEDIERAFKVGQHQVAQAKIAAFFKDEMGPLVAESTLLKVQDLKNKYEEQTDRLAKVKTYLTEFPKRFAGEDKTYWTSAANIILGELNHDTLAKLALFADYAAQHQREIADKKSPSQDTEQVLAIAVTGWMLGNAAAEPDIKTARMLWRGRQMMLDYLKMEDKEQRARQLASFIRQFEPKPDVVARLIKMLPPANPYPLDKVGDEPIKLDTDVPQSSDDATYLVQLPPDYHHQRQYPVLMLLQGHREKAEAMMARFTELAAKHGYIIVAPLWGKGKGIRPAYGFTETERNIVLDSLRDARRRFQIDSDRVFLFGWEQGADAAFDVALSHPDQFAGVLPMNGVARAFLGERYWPNAQYLPFYMVQGDRNGAPAKANRELFGLWVKGHFASLYVEYKGRVSEWYDAELPKMFDWMERKKRASPTKELGRWGGEEFASMRKGDNRFYWLSTDPGAFSEKVLNPNIKDWVRTRKPALLQANIAVGNESGLKKEANIWTQINIRSYGLKEATVWLAPNMIDFTKPIKIRVDGNTLAGTKVITPSLTVLLEDYYLMGDKSRLWLAKVPVKLQ